MMLRNGLTRLEREIKTILVSSLDSTGILYRLFSRVKDDKSIVEKVSRKDYPSSLKLMQDIIGFRITTYFIDDVNIIIDHCENIFDRIELVKDELSTTDFSPIRKNMVCCMPPLQKDYFLTLKDDDKGLEYVDNTFEIQFRTTFSEGWHEVEHMMRYKCSSEWEGLVDEGRMLNGLYATLETSDRTLKALFEDISYSHYKNKRWEAMIRNKFRLKFNPESLNDDLKLHFQNSSDFAKQIVKMDRVQVIQSYLKSKFRFPLTFNNWIYYINFTNIRDETILNTTPKLLLDDFNME